MTKRCAICGTRCDEDAASCPECGEASWLPGPAKAKPAPKPVAKAAPKRSSRRSRSTKKD